MTQSPNISILVKLVLLLASSMTVMAGATISPALPSMAKAFSTTQNVSLLIPLVLTMPALFIALCGTASGFVIDKWGRKKLLLLSLALYGVAGTSGFFLSSLSAILIGRAVLGVAVAGIMTTCTTLIADYFVGEQRYQFMGIQASFMSFGGVLFLTLGGFLAQANWRSPFLIYLFAFIVLPLAAYAIYEPQKAEVQVNNSINEENVNWPLKQLALIYGLALGGMIIFYMIPVKLPFLLSDLKLGNAAQAGMAIACSTLASGITSTQFLHVRAKFNFSAITSFVFLLMGIGYSVIAMSTTYLQILLGLIISGLGMGLLIPNLNVGLVEIIPLKLRGRAVGGLTTAIFLGQFFSPLVSQPISNATSLSFSYLIMGIFMLLVALGFGWTQFKPKPKLS